MIERDLDREDSQNTSLQFQKTINEVNIYSDITYPPPSIPLKRQQNSNAGVQSERRRPLGVLSATSLQPISKHTTLVERPQARSSKPNTTTGSKKKVWFCDKQKLYFPNGL